MKRLACDHAFSLYLCNLFAGGGQDTFLSQIPWKKARIWTFFVNGQETIRMICVVAIGQNAAIR